MNPLVQDLQSPKSQFEEFFDVTVRVLNYLPTVISSKKEIRGYSLLSSEVAGTRKFVRPIRNDLFLFSPAEFQTEAGKFLSVLERIQNDRTALAPESGKIIDKVAYTIQQSAGVGLDLLSNPNSARKHVGNRFEELIRLVISGLGLANKKVIFKIPYPLNEKEKMYSCETDMIVSPYKEVRSNTQHIDEQELVVSLKTSSKDRLGKIFLDKMLMEKFAGHPVKVAGIFLNDVQRKEADNISYTFVSGLFMVYTKFLCTLEGVYFIDPPAKTREAPLQDYVFPFSRFILEDVVKLLTS